MNLNFRGLIAIGVGLMVAGLYAQKPVTAPVAQVGAGSPLPVYVVNDVSRLPEGFEPGSTWTFSSWTTPSSLTFSARVDKTEGGWAYLTLTGGAAHSSRWYYVPQMPGAWERQ